MQAENPNGLGQTCFLIRYGEIKRQLREISGKLQKAQRDLEQQTSNSQCLHAQLERMLGKNENFHGNLEKVKGENTDLQPPSKFREMKVFQGTSSQFSGGCGRESTTLILLKEGEGVSWTPSSQFEGGHR